MTNEHRAPWDCVLSKAEDEEGGCLPGDAPRGGRDYFEILSLCILQAGLNWSSIRKHWPRYREGFLGFDPERLAGASVEKLLQSPNVIRNNRKVSAIVHNAQAFRAIESEHGSFRGFLETLRPLSEREKLKALAKHFKQVGPETADYFLHSVGFGA
ncbi:MAG TPA: DNA-3-methyladenine glycosylase I [Pyrinomonadaceae bacterium]|nr:DNA-3-methyladenine glycosylase I [Pyrinomonadaceae bacterium]